MIGKEVSPDGPLSHICQPQLTMWQVVTQNCAQFSDPSITRTVNGTMTCYSPPLRAPHQKLTFFFFFC